MGLYDIARSMVGTTFQGFMHFKADGNCFSNASIEHILGSVLFLGI